MKTLAEWDTGKYGDFDEYVKIGDIVDEEMALHFAEVVSGGYFDGKISQCGEANNEKDGIFLYQTFEKIEGTETWRYVGDRYSRHMINEGLGGI